MPGTTFARLCAWSNKNPGSQRSRMNETFAVVAACQSQMSGTTTASAALTKGLHTLTSCRGDGRRSTSPAVPTRSQVQRNVCGCPTQKRSVLTIGIASATRRS